MPNNGLHGLDLPRLDLVGIIPMKPLPEGKRRLASGLTSGQRAILILTMLRRVIKVLQGASVDPIWVVGGDEQIIQLARNSGSLWLEDPGRSLNDTLNKSFDRAFQENRSALYIPGDLPFVKASDIHHLVAASRHLNNITLAPAARDGGTNGIVVPVGSRFRTELGRHSFTKHVAQTSRLGIPIAIFYSSGLSMDLDTMDDLESYRQLDHSLFQSLNSPSIQSPIRFGDRGDRVKSPT